MNDCINIRQIIIDGRKATAREDFFEGLRSQLGADLLAGSNLDALHDALTSLDEPAELVILDRTALENNLGSYWDRTYTMLMDCLDENSGLALSFGEDE